MHCVMKHDSSRLDVFTPAIHVRNYVCIYTPFPSFSPVPFFSSSSSFFISLPVWFRSSLFRARAKKKTREISFWFQWIHIDQKKKKKKERRILFLFSVSSVLIQVRTCSSDIRLFSSLRIWFISTSIFSSFFLCALTVMMWRDRTRTLNLVT